MAYVFLAMAIISEVIGSTTLKFTNGFKRLLPTILCLAAYGFAYYSISLTLRVMPLNVAYATWCGVGTVLTVICGALIYKEKITTKTLAGVTILISGTIMLNYFN